MKHFALGRLPTGQRNKLEAEYERMLESQKEHGTVKWFRFEGLKLRLADNTFYTPDFAVMADDGIMECHECKGFWTDDARVKIKVAAEMYPFRFFAVKKLAKNLGGGWDYESFGGVTGESGK